MHKSHGGGLPSAWGQILSWLPLVEVASIVLSCLAWCVLVQDHVADARASHGQVGNVTFMSRFPWWILVVGVGPFPPLTKLPFLLPGGPGEIASHGATVRDPHRTPPLEEWA